MDVAALAARLSALCGILGNPARISSDDGAAYAHVGVVVFQHHSRAVHPPRVISLNHTGPDRGQNAAQREREMSSAADGRAHSTTVGEVMRALLLGEAVRADVAAGYVDEAAARGALPTRCSLGVL